MEMEAEYDVNGQFVVPKRTDYISWDDYFMATALLSARRSKDPTQPTGCCIVDSQNRIIGIGYNGFPAGCLDDCLPWNDSATNSTNSSTPWLHTANPYVVHAEVNAILNKGSADVAGACLYTRYFPCHECAKVIAQAGIRQVVFQVNPDRLSDSSKASRILLQMAGVSIRQYKPDRPLIELNFASCLPSENEAKLEVLGHVSETSELACNKNLQKMEQFKDHCALLKKEADYDPLCSSRRKRSDYISWDDYFMAMAFLTAQRSKDPNTQVGACIVDRHQRIVALGYNGFPAGASDDVLPWSRTAVQPLHRKYHYVCHAEVNAVLNKCSDNVKDTTLYVALFPCNECAKVLVQAGVKEVVYMSDIYHDTDSCRASRILFHMAGVKLRQYSPTCRLITVPLEGNKERGFLGDTV